MMRRYLILLLSIAWVAGCHRIPSNAPPSISAIYVPAPALGDSGLVAIDTASLRPVAVGMGAGPQMVTTFQNGRYHSETVRAISGDSAVIANTASLIMQRGGATPGIFLDFQDIAPEDLRSFANLLRAITAAARSLNRSPVALFVPPRDTLSYPTDILGRVVDIVIVRAYGDHRPGTSAGAPTTAEFVRRALGLRSVVIGPSRVVAELPLFGYRWERDGNARAISYAEAARNVNSEAGSFRRDPASQFLVATGRDGWTAWVPDGRTIEYLISVVRQSGVSAVALAGIRNAAPDIREHVANAVRR